MNVLDPGAGGSAQTDQSTGVPSQRPPVAGDSHRGGAAAPTYAVDLPPLADSARLSGAAPAASVLYRCGGCGSERRFTAAEAASGLGIPLCSCGVPPVLWAPVQLLRVRNWFVPVPPVQVQAQEAPSALLGILVHRLRGEF